jgi:hypothetical protein
MPRHAAAAVCVAIVIVVSEHREIPKAVRVHSIRSAANAGEVRLIDRVCL